MDSGNLLIGFQHGRIILNHLDVELQRTCSSIDLHRHNMIENPYFGGTVALGLRLLLNL